MSVAKMDSRRLLQVLSCVNLALQSCAMTKADGGRFKFKTDIIGLAKQFGRSYSLTREEIEWAMATPIAALAEEFGVKAGEYRPRKKAT